jgi:hypothetical protein
MKTIVFSNSLSSCKKGFCIDLAERRNALDKKSEFEVLDISSMFDRFGEDWFKQFSAWIGALNCNNGGLFWWAHIATAKNVLSSSLGQRYFQVQAICEFATSTDFDTLNVIGATPAQIEVIKTRLAGAVFQWRGQGIRLKWWHKMINDLKSLVKLWIQFAALYVGFFNYRIPKLDDAIELCLFTYMDGLRREGLDNYFGKLPELLRDNHKPLSTIYLAYVYKPYWKRLKQITKESHSEPYIALQGLLRMSDYFWAVSKTCREWWVNRSIDRMFYKDFSEYSPLLREAFIKEIGGYFHNLLVYRAMLRFMKHHQPKVMMYPFENKSLEKMILLAVKNSKNSVKTVGYQHTSITPKHSTLLFSSGEAACTPLPDSILTVGEITKNYLENFGYYPPGIFIQGGALRQVWSEPLSREGNGNIRVLLALSSSEAELLRSIEFFELVMKNLPDLELGIRPHPNFPLTLLPPKLNQWVEKHAINFSNTFLQDNLNWCSVTAYVSSTVALEALMRGKPVINFSIGDIISSDPIIEEVSFHWSVKNHLDMRNTLIQIHQISDNDYEDRRLQAINYIQNYLSPMNHAALKNFKGVLCE